MDAVSGCFQGHASQSLNSGKPVMIVDQVQRGTTGQTPAVSYLNSNF